jgi:hypothetical protein
MHSTMHNLYFHLINYHASVTVYMVVCKTQKTEEVMKEIEYFAH